MKNIEETQDEIINKIIDNPHGRIIVAPRIGKTKIAIELINRNIKMTLIRKILSITVAMCLFSTVIKAQENEKLDKKWHLKDIKEDGLPGMSVTKAYNKIIPKLKTPKESIIVAVIDSGVDVSHEDMKGKIWVNKDEIPNNGIDDDKNGYIDDVHGWNFLGNSQTNVGYDTFEVTREYKRLVKKYANMSENEMKKDKEYEYYKKAKKDIDYQHNKIKENDEKYGRFLIMYSKINDFLKTYAQVDKLSMKVLESIKSDDKTIMEFVNQMKDWISSGTTEDRVNGLKDFLETYRYGYDLDFDPRYIVGDDYNDLNDKKYGNNQYIGHKGEHGTHVAGIIAAKRGNNIGMDGIAKYVRIMAVRAVPDGDERDKDVGNAIFYAVDNGARVINMSFGKSYASQPEYVKKAMRYAKEKGVLMIHASGNDGKDNDNSTNFPNAMLDGKEASNWLEIGASTARKDDLIAEFSNYGKKSVSFFAPGEDIYSTYPNNEYKSNSGTSMAAPMVAGVAALVLSYYPKISSDELKKILIQSATQHKQKVNKPVEKENDPKTKVTLAEVTKYGGIVNAYKALKLAGKYYKKNRLK